MAGTASPIPGLPAQAASALRASLAADPAIAALPATAMAGLLDQLESACRGYLADRAVVPGTRSGDVAERLAQAAAAAQALARAVEALDGVGWGLIGRGLREAAGAGEEGPPADVQTLFACVRRIRSTLEASADRARGEPQVGLERARLRLAAGVGAALEGAGIALEPVAWGPFAGCVRAVLTAVGLETPPVPELLLERAAKVARRERARSASG